ncbi:AAA family ATPase [Inconstantimicrobium porci]|uniref:MoxR family ATPase n=1 Tax=Inconstantimicrobium porci TaxID=2652291 RepID=A0A7X2MZC7_9CLOT|nr:MoxR family ATPase [Inconstantimicrobium porci]MDD6770444.1 MoxR family ATPase [Inconstantimicrobium porci]MSR91823.1 MoxR family ATPase [Inconstantimicrobium porci]
MDTKKYSEFKDKIVENVSKVMVGKNDVVELIVVSFICGGHVLLEDVPGVGKTVMVKSFSGSIGSKFTRIQFTPDLLPSDLTGINFYNQKNMEFEFREGPLFSNIIVADEINRATPRTQSSLLEAMEEKQITVDKLTRKLDSPFMVLATQNPVESYGTYPLPEAQLDRFLMRIDMGYPSFEEEAEVVRRSDNKNLSAELGTVVSKEDIEYVQEHYTEVTMNDVVVNYLLDIVNATRNKENILLGISPRGTIALYKASKAYAAINGRDFVIPEDVKHMAPFVLNHRVKFRGSKGKGIYDNINELLEKVPVPTEEI